jgi:hypothetical protein
VGGEKEREKEDDGWGGGGMTCSFENVAFREWRDEAELEFKRRRRRRRRRMAAAAANAQAAEIKPAWTRCITMGFWRAGAGVVKEGGGGGGV